MAAIVFILLFFLPLLVVPFSSPFEAPKVILAEILIEVLTFSFFIRTSREVIIKIAKSPKVRLIFGLVILSLIHLIFFRSPITFFGNPFRLQGVFLLWHLLIFSVISSSIKLDQIPKFVYLISLLGLFLGTLIMGGNEAGRAVGTLGEPNALAGAAIFIWPFAWFYRIPSKFPIKWIYLLIVLVVIFLSGSRSGLLALAIQVIFLTLTSLRSTTKSTILCLILIALGFILPLVEGGGWFENRSQVWSTALISGLQNPIFGSGFGNMEYTLKQTSRLINNNIQYQYVDSSHNFLLDFWVGGGILGLILIISILYISLLGLTRSKNRLLLCAFLGVLTVMSFNPVSVVTLLAFWFLIGQGFNLDKLRHDKLES